MKRCVVKVVHSGSSDHDFREIDDLGSQLVARFWHLGSRILPPFRCLCFVLLLLNGTAHADDVGLISARLIEREGHEYVIESDVVPRMVGMLGKPILPVAFTLDEPEYRRQGMVMTVRYTFRGVRPLAADDVLLLPWNRMGVILNARWLDGTQANVLFSRRPDGIPVIVRMLRPQVKSASQVFYEQVQGGFLAALTSVGHWLLIFSLVVFVPLRTLVSQGFYILVGLMLALLVADFAAVTVPPLLAEGLLLIAALLVARAAALPHVLATNDGAAENRQERSKAPRFAPVLLIIGLVLGISHVADIAKTGAAAGHTPTALAGFVLGISAFYISLTVAVTVLLALGSRFLQLRTFVAFAVGSAAVAGLVHVVVMSGEPVKHAEASNRQQLFPKMSQTGTGRAGTAPAPRKLTDPFIAFLVVEPYEVRYEVLASVRTLVEHLEFALEESDTIRIEEQAELKIQALAFLGEGTSLRINGVEGVPNTRRADFLTLGIGGAVTRARPVPESVDTAVLGLTAVYSTSGPPDEVSLKWEDLPDGVESIPLTLTDPLQVEGTAISAQSPAAVWKNDLGTFQPPEVKAVEVSPPTWAILSAVLLVVSLGVCTAGGIGWNVSRLLPLAYGCTIAALAVYPMVRAPLNLPLVGRTAMPKDQAATAVERLLTNVYRSFSFREESDIYDQLEVSVTGDPLTEIYLQQRRALELENRGGARARVDQVEVTKVETVKAESEGGVSITASWNVSGSVNHFGHTHYRRNQYSAVLHIRPVDGVWKISAIEVKDEQRVL